jgi:hypothetical protein
MHWYVVDLGSERWKAAPSLSDLADTIRDCPPGRYEITEVTQHTPFKVESRLWGTAERFEDGTVIFTPAS